MQMFSGKRKLALVFLFVLLGVSFMAAQKPRENGGQRLRPSGAGHGVIPDAGPAGQAVVAGNGINYHGGPVMQGTVNVYVIWYGNWNGVGSDTALTRNMIEHFLGAIGGSALELVNTTYGDKTGNVSGNVAFGGSTIVNNAQNLTDGLVQAQVNNAIASGALPSDTNGVYFVLSSSNINETSGFCTQYCGWHAHIMLGGSDIKYSFVGNVDRCPVACEFQPTGPNSPAANVGGIDGIANLISYELEEAISDPDLNAWFDIHGQENADKCSFNFGLIANLSTCPANGLCTPAGNVARAKYNQTFGNNNWLLQENWRNSGGGACAQHL